MNNELKIIKPFNPIILALDTDCLRTAGQLIFDTKGAAGGYKIGMELLYGNMFGQKDQSLANFMQGYVNGSAWVLDIKMKDIGTTVAKALKALLTNLYYNNIGWPFLITMHADEWLTNDAIKRVNTALDEVSITIEHEKPMLTGVTLLTSVTLNSCENAGFGDAEFEGFEDIVHSRAESWVDAGMKACICSPQEIAMLKGHFPELQLLVPGSRSENVATHDQQRVMTPKEAINAGANYIVIGREASEANNPAKALFRILADIS